MESWKKHKVFHMKKFFFLFVLIFVRPLNNFIGVFILLYKFRKFFQARQLKEKNLYAGKLSKKDFWGT